MEKINHIHKLAALNAENTTPLLLQSATTAIAAVQHYNHTGVISETVTPISNSVITPVAHDTLREFATSRHSVRNYDNRRALERSVIEEIIELSSTTPSVCNRRSYRAHYYDDPGAISRLLELQNGNAGFGHTVPGLLVITEQRSAFVGAGERNQRWVDGGLFAMSIVWFAHARGLSTCFLNWSQPNFMTKKLRNAADIDPAEDVIVLIAVGYGAKDHRVTRSPLRTIDETFIIH